MHNPGTAAAVMLMSDPPRHYAYSRRERFIKRIQREAFCRANGLNGPRAVARRLRQAAMRAAKA